MSVQAATSSVTQSALDSYNEVPYESFAYPQTHPRHLYVLGTLFGLTPPDFRKARVLELGCAGGGNLLPVALAYPEINCLGLDLSQEQINQAEEARQFMALSNIKFEQKDILSFDIQKNKEQFHYILCHGVFSWVPALVRERILELCTACLSPNGLAVISYNTLPGWSAVRSLREMMLFHTNRFSRPQEKIAQARALLDFLADNVPEGRVYRSLIDEERKILKAVNDSYVYHDHLEETNNQFYLHEFVQLAKEKGLFYLGDSSLTTMFVGNMPKDAMVKLQALNDVVNQEQYMDFVTNRRFRVSILCKDPRTVNRNLHAEQIMNYFLLAQMQPERRELQERMTFKTKGGGTFTTHNLQAGALFLELTESTHPIAAADLINRVQTKLNLSNAKILRQILIHYGLDLVLRGFIHLHADSPNFVTTVSEKPVIFPLARYQAGKKNCRTVTNVLSTTVNTDAIGNMIIVQLNGTRTIPEIVDLLTEKAVAGTLTVQKNQKTVTTKKEIQREVKKAVDSVLTKLAQQALLIA